jgi:hypothetical protein
MNPAIGYQLATAQIADHHHRAQRDQAARAAIRARRAPQRGHRHPAPRRSAAALTRHALTMLGARSTCPSNQPGSPRGPPPALSPPRRRETTTPSS